MKNSTLPEQKRKKTRSDKGVYQLTPRDFFVLTWIADQYAMRFDHVRRLLSENAEGETKADLLAIPTVQGKISKWVHAGWAKYQRWLNDGPGWVWITKQGLSEIGQRDYHAAPPSVTRLAHIYAVNEVRFKTDWKTWTSERALRADREVGDTAPIPDALMSHDDGTLFAIEVEISVKKPADLLLKIERLLSHYEHVWFFVPDEPKSHVFNAVGRARGKLDLRSQRRVALTAIDLSAMPPSLDD
jgi:hypothetical protein